jgi:hypothetical protein
MQDQEQWAQNVEDRSSTFCTSKDFESRKDEDNQIPSVIYHGTMKWCLPIVPFSFRVFLSLYSMFIPCGCTMCVVFHCVDSVIVVRSVFISISGILWCHDSP